MKQRDEAPSFGQLRRGRFLPDSPSLPSGSTPSMGGSVPTSVRVLAV